MMRIAEALDAFRPHRGDAIVVPGRGGRYWVEQTNRPDLDAPLGDPAMGGHAGFALGLALARPERKLVLFDSEGDILMSLGMLSCSTMNAMRRPAASPCRTRKTSPMTRSRSRPAIRARTPFPNSPTSRLSCRQFCNGPDRSSYG